MINSKLAVDVLPGEAQVPDAEGALLANRGDEGVGKHLLALQVIAQCPEGGRFLRGADSFQTSLWELVWQMCTTMGGDAT